MTIAAHFPPGDPEFDVCIIGAGPAGLAVALQCEAHGLSTLVIEAGARKPGRSGTALTEADILNERHHEPLHVTTCQAFGGTTWAWGGHCVPFDAIDFEARPYVPESGWPIGPAEVSCWYKAASTFLDCGEPVFRMGAPEWQDLHGVSVESNDRQARTPKLARRYRDRVENSRNIWLCLETVAIRLQLDPTGERVVGLRTKNGTICGPAPRARLYVLAGGGLQTTRLLLGLQCDWPRHFGGDDGPLGRHYMGHIGGEIATIVFNAEEDATEFLIKKDGQGIPTQRRFRIDDELQRSAHILNTVFLLRTAPLDDYPHGSGALSLLRLSSLVLGNSIGPQRLGGPHDISKRRHHLLNMLKDPVRTVTDISRLIGQKFILQTDIPIIVRNKSGRYALRYHAEQVPNPDSRVQLANRFTALGARPLSIDFRFTEQDARSVIQAHEILDRALQVSGKGRLEYWNPPEERLSAVLAQASDGYHQVGTTRMRASAREGVVDADCRVNGVRNLFIASSSVFPTTGHANPTFMIVALAIRLAKHVADLLSKSEIKPGNTVQPTNSVNRSIAADPQKVLASYFPAQK